MVVEKTDLARAEVIHDLMHFLGVAVGRVHQPGHETHPCSGAVVVFDAQLAPAAPQFGGHDLLRRRAARIPNRGSAAR